MKRIIMFLLFIVLVMSNTSVMASDNLKWFGPAVVGKANIPEVASWSNLISIEQDLSITDPGQIARLDAEQVLLAAQYGAKSLLFCFNIFFVYDEASGIIVLRDDYADRWRQFSGILKPHEQHIWGVLTLDEPFLTGLRQGWSIRETRNIINEINYLIKKTLPSVNTIGALRILPCDLNQEYLFGTDVYIPLGSIEDWGLPTYDVVGIFYYYTQVKLSGTSLENFKREWKNRFCEFESYLLPLQKVVLIPGTFIRADVDNTGVSTGNDLLELVNLYLEVGESDPNVIGIIPFLYRSAGNLVGLQNLPRIIGRWKNIGRDICKYDKINIIAEIQLNGGLRYRIGDDWPWSIWYNNERTGYLNLEFDESGTVGYTVYDIENNYVGILLWSGIFKSANGDTAHYTIYDNCGLWLP